MNKHLFSVYDSAAGMYLDPFVSPSQEFAIREFRRVVNKPGHQFNEFPEDYTLFYIGEFNPENGEIAANHPLSLGVAITFKDQMSLSEQLDLEENGRHG
mgnify:CR=1 FL=1